MPNDSTNAIFSVRSSPRSWNRRLIRRRRAVLAARPAGQTCPRSAATLPSRRPLLLVEACQGALGRPGRATVARGLPLPLGQRPLPAPVGHRGRLFRRIVHARIDIVEQLLRVAKELRGERERLLDLAPDRRPALRRHPMLLGARSKSKERLDTCQYRG